jgi:hypothetical protein
VLPEKYFKFLAEYNDIYFRFGTTYENIFGESKTTTFILLGLLVVLAFKNSMELRLTFFNLPKIFIYISIILMAYTLTNMTKFTEFLYFNF